MFELALASNPNVPGFVKSTPIARVGDPKEVAAVIAFLLSDEASFVSGATYSADGGLMA